MIKVLIIMMIMMIIIVLIIMMIIMIILSISYQYPELKFSKDHQYILTPKDTNHSVTLRDTPL